ncbi:hypothetical protein FRC12_001093 [Ceratobasidium sp. 428]|nr:hypothetical protein FRC12_001093 [Ceratobasidium sp. 428]
MPGAASPRSGDIELFKLWSAVTGASGMQKFTAGGQWENVANHIGLQLPLPLSGSSHPPAGQLAQLYFVLMAPLEEHMKRSAQAKPTQMLAVQQQLQNQNQNPGANLNVQEQSLMPAQMHLQQQNNQAPGLGDRQGTGVGVGGMDVPNTGGDLGMQPPGLGGIGGQAQSGPMLTPAQMHAMRSGGMGTGVGDGLDDVRAGSGAGVGVGAGLNGGTGAGFGGAGDGMGRPLGNGAASTRCGTGDESRIG